VADQTQQEIHDECVSQGLIAWILAQGKDLSRRNHETRLDIAHRMLEVFLRKSNDTQIRGCLLSVAKYLYDRQASVIEALAESLDGFTLSEVNKKVECIIVGSILENKESETDDSNETAMERLQQRNKYLENELRGADEDIEELKYALQEVERELASCRGNQPHPRRMKRRTRDTHLNVVEYGSISSESTSPTLSSSLRTITSTNSASTSFQTIRPTLTNYITEMMEKNGKFLQLLADNPDDIYTFGHCSACTVILHAICNTSDLSQLEKLMQLYAIIWDTDMMVSRQAKEMILCIDMKGPMSLALRALYKVMLQNSSEDGGGGRDAALDAYNKYNGTNKTSLPSNAFTSTGKINNNISIAMFQLIGIRVSKNISLDRMHQGGLSDPVKDAERKQRIAALINFIVEMTGARPNDSVTIAWIYMNVLVPACDSPSHEVRSRMIQHITFLIEEMHHPRYIEDTENAEVIAMTKLADNVDSYELTGLRETFKDSLYICERMEVSESKKADDKKGDFKATWRRKVVPRCSSRVCARKLSRGVWRRLDFSE